MTFYLGVDPGISGGIATVGTGMWKPLPSKMPDTEKDIADLIASLKDAEFCVIEAVHSMPKQGVASSFKFGQNYGFLRACLVCFQIPFEEVSPQKWQKTMNCLTKGDKNISKRRAQQLFPGIKITHATADALLLAEYCRITHPVTQEKDPWDGL